MSVQGFRARLALSALSATWLIVGCSQFGEIRGGPAVGLQKDDLVSPGAEVDLGAGLGLATIPTETAGIDLAFRGMVTSQSQHLAIAQGIFIAERYGLVRGGGQIVFEHFDNNLLVGMGGYGALEGLLVLSSRTHTVPGVFVRDKWILSKTLLTFGPTLELDARFTRGIPIAFYGFTVGLMWTDEETDPPKDDDERERDGDGDVKADR
jgi:hypothetical protein